MLNGSQKRKMSCIQAIKTKLNFKYEAERAEREGDYGKVAEIRYGK
jgi:ATP-dependent Clp protease ATP-binding subunit ClpB